jgi:hypothetical protein
MDRRSTELSKVIRNTLEQTICVELLPRSQIDVCVQVRPWGEGVQVRPWGEGMQGGPWGEGMQGGPWGASAGSVMWGT